MDIRQENYNKFLLYLEEQKTDADYNPVQLMVALTNVCNLHCAFCPYCGFCSQKIEKPEMLSLDLLYKIQPYFKTARFFNPSVRGEPFLYQHFDELIHLCKTTGLNSVMQLINNGTQLQRYDLKKLEGINVISISFDGADKKTFEILRYGADFEQVLENMTKLRETLPDSVLQMTVVVNRLNLYQLPDIYKTCREKGFNYITYNAIYGPDEDKVVQLLRLRESDHPLFTRKMREIEQLNSDGKLTVRNIVTFDDFEDNAPLNKEIIYNSLLELKNQKPYLNYDAPSPSAQEMRRVKTERKSLPEEKKTKVKRLPYCTSPWTVFNVFPNGDVCPCCAGFGPIDNLMGKTLDEVWNGPAFQQLRESMFDCDMLPDYCKECKAFARYDSIDDLCGQLFQNSVEDIIIPPHYFPGDNIKNPLLKAKIGLVNQKREQEFLKAQSKAVLSGKPINSKEYWEARFSTDDWDKYGGDKQSEFFSQVAVDTFPDWLKEELNRNEWNILDVGCAEGDGSALLARNFPSCRVTGMDFSESAVENAKARFPHCDFIVGDATETIEFSDVIFSSNTLEHLKQPRSVLKNFCTAAEKYAVVLLPFEDHFGIAEHINIFCRDFFPFEIEQCYLKYYTVIDCAPMKSPYWQGKQILLIYVNAAYQPQGQMSAETLYQSYTSLWEQKAEQLSAELSKQEKVIRDLEDVHTKLDSQLAAVKAEKAELDSQLSTVKAEKVELDLQFSALKQKNAELVKRAKEISGKLQGMQNSIWQVREFCYALAGTRLFKLVHFISRLKHQGIHGTGEERKKFRKWLSSRFHHTPDFDRRFNPLFGVIGMLDNALSTNQISDYSEKQNTSEEPSDARIRILGQSYKKFDVIVLAVIDFDFRYQRPQHFAAKFAENGHRIFYVNATHFRESSVRQVRKNLFVADFKNNLSTAIHLTDWSQNSQELERLFDELLRQYCIRDAVVVVDYPNWVHGAEYLRERYGFKLVTDYMDDFTGFLNPANQLVKQNCVELLKTSDAVIPSSQFLYGIASKYNSKCSIVRNGGEYEHFHKAFGAGSGTGKKIIGYYGAIAEWFDAEKVCYLAEHLPDCEILLIGEVTTGKDQFLKHGNIRLTGEMPYQQLPEQLAKFDVCLIPFETKTDLIKATNPVKFYEYLSAGKKIVATEIPELEPYRGEYVYLANDNEQFLQYVQLCLSGEDMLVGPEERAAFGKENDWQARYDAFSALCVGAVPKVSIIVLTYNNLELNKKCIQSILDKTAYPLYELIVVDNASTDGTREYLEELQKQKVPKVKVILNDENKGFAGGNNVGIRAAEGDYVLLLNNDTIVTRGWITSLAKHLENEPLLGMCGPVTNSIGNEAKIKVDYRELDGLDDFADRYTWQHMGQVWKDPRMLALFCTLIKREVIDNCGLLDESYKVGMFEDDDYSEAVKEAGYRLAIAEDSFIHHFDGSSFKRLEDEKYRAVFDANKEVFEKKWEKKWVAPVYRPGLN